MSEIELPDDKGKRTIKFSISLDDETAQAEAQPDFQKTSPFVDEARLFEMVNLVTVTGQRNTEHGMTSVRLVKFRDEAQRQKIIRLLGESFQQVVEKLIPLLFYLGAHPQATIRQRAAKTVGELMGEIDFIRYKNAILLPWALSDHPYLNASVGIALTTAAQNPTYADNVKSLLKNWATTNNPNLNWTAVASSVQLGSRWPAETLDLLEVSLKRDWLDLLILATYTIRRLCKEKHTDLVMSRLAQWVCDQEAKPSLRRAGALIFLNIISLSHLVDNRQLLDDAVEIFLVGLSDRAITNSGAIRQAMLDELKSWAEESFDDEKKQSTMETLTMRMYLRAETQRDKDRITFHLDRWRRTDKRFDRFARGLVK
jgi:hypothetical protein